MLLRLFKNDLIRGKINNIVMLLFIMISAMLSCASISMLYSTTKQISYFMDDIGNVADMNFMMMNVGEKDKEAMEDFMLKNNIADYQIESQVNLPLTAMTFVGYESIKSMGCYATSSSQEYNKIVDEDNQPLSIQQGEIGIPLSLKKQLDLKKGDLVEIQRGTQLFTYKISSFLRDSLFGSEMMGQKRFIFHEVDFQQQYHATSQVDHALLLSVKSQVGRESLENEMQKASFPNYLLISKETARLSYLGLQAGSSAIMLMSGIILLGIGFLIIRFTILFQMEENYAEIGIMKAIGLSHKQIKPLYVTKYVGISIIGSCLGFLASIPFCDMIESMQTGVVPVLPSSTGTYLSSIIIIVLIILVFFITTIVFRKIKMQSAMDAIRRGNEGETFQAHAKLALSKRKRMSVSVYMASSDMLAQMKNTILVIIIYAFSLLLVLFPLFLKNSFEGGAFLEALSVSRGDVYTQQDGSISVDRLKEKQEVLKNDLKEYDAFVDVKIETLASCTLNDEELYTSAFIMKRALGNESVHYDQGVGPLLENEIALSETLAKKYDKTVGDSIDITIDNVEKLYLITGVYSSMMNLGNTILAGEDLQYSFANTGYLVVNFSEDDDALRQKVLSEYHEIELIDLNEMMTNLSGDMAAQIGAISDLMSIIFLSIVFALSTLFAKMQILRGKKAITILQSLGYTILHIRIWQMWKCILQASVGILLGILFHQCFSARILKVFFQEMGMGGIQLEYGTWSTYVLYPLCFFMTIIIGQIFVNLTIFKWNVKDLSGE